MSIYFAQVDRDGPIKIGCSINVDARLKNLESQYGKPLTLLKIMPGGRDEERAIHERFAEHRIGRTEQFRPVAEIMEFIGLPLLVGPNPDAVEAIPSKPWGQSSPMLMIRIDEDSKDVIRRAAEYRGISLSDYVRMVVVEQARKDIRAAERQKKDDKWRASG